MSAPDGLVIVDKPAGWTSHDVVARIRQLAGTRRVGHAGTLDPLATGVLVVGVGRATKLLTYLVGADKSYTATIRLGVSTVTDDSEGEVLARQDVGRSDSTALEAAVRRLTGKLQQVPSSVSAVKVEGQRAYARVRSGERVELNPRAVTVHRFEVVARRPDHDHELAVLDLDVEVDVTSGTYIRALARDLGAALGVGGHLTALRRTAVGPYTLQGAHTLATLDAELAVLCLADAARAAFATRDLDADEVRALRHGQRVDASERGVGPVAAFAPDGSLVALLEDRGPSAKSLIVIPAC